MSAPQHRLWCDDFDADLLKVVPDALEEVGEMADYLLWTHSHLTYGRINSPSSWWTDLGLTAFFSTPGAPNAPAHYWTPAALVECTWLEALRDEWVHGAVVAVDQRVIWTPSQRDMQALMWDLRGAMVLSDRKRRVVQRRVVHGIAMATGQLARMGLPAS